jgi:hypothetical protein
MTCIAAVPAVAACSPILLSDVELLTVGWSSLGPNDQTQAIETAKNAARAWVRRRGDLYTAERAVGSNDFYAFLYGTFGEEGAHRWGRLEDGWVEDESDFRCCHFCAELETERRRMFGLPLIPTDVQELQSALLWAEARFWKADAASGRAWAAIRDDYLQDRPGLRETAAFQAYEATKEAVNDALSDALLVRMLLNAATGTVRESDVWECRACLDGESEDGEEIEVHRATADAMMDVEEEDFTCPPKGAGNRAEIALVCV